MQALPPRHAVSRLRDVRLARSAKPFIARGARAPRCPGCRVLFSHCLYPLRPDVPTQADMCLIMCDIEPLKPSNTGWLIADVVKDTAAFGWTRTEVDPALVALLAEQLSRYRLRRSTRTDHLCTSEVVARCLALAGEEHAADTLDTYLEVFTRHYMDAKQSVLPDLEDAAHLRLRELVEAI